LSLRRVAKVFLLLFLQKKKNPSFLKKRSKKLLPSVGTAHGA